MGTSYSYGWWMVVFQLTGICSATVTATLAPARRFSAALLHAVLTTSTFLWTNNVFVGFGANGAAANMLRRANMAAAGQFVDPQSPLNKGQQALFVLLAGLVIVDVGNVLVLLTLADETHSAQCKKPPPASPPTAAKDAAEAAAVAV